MRSPPSTPETLSERSVSSRSDRASATMAGGPEGIIQCNTFLDSVADKQGKINYGVISQHNTEKEKVLHEAVEGSVGKMVRRQATLHALEAAGLGNDFEQYAAGGNIGSGGLASLGQEIRSSHSGGAIDPLLPQPAYEAAPVAGVSVAPPPLNTLADRANYQHLADTTTEHTTDPTVAAKNDNRVASYMELTAGSVSLGKDKAVTGTRVVYDPFSGKHFVSDHYQKQYELTNVPSPNAHPHYGTLLAKLQAAQAHPNYVNAASPAAQKKWLQKNVYDKIIEHMGEGKY